MSDEQDDPEVEREAALRAMHDGDDDREMPEGKPNFEALLDALKPAWWEALNRYDATTLAAWDERVKRMERGIATDEDKRVQEEATEALKRGQPLPLLARRMPRYPPVLNVELAQRAVAMGIPPLIAERICSGDVLETRSTRACARVGTDHFVLVLCGERGCGKTYAAADWLLMTEHRIPRILEKRVSTRFFLEATLIPDIPYAERTNKLGYARALVLDDVGTEHDAFVRDLATILVQRYRNALPTVVTTNLNEAEFSERYGMRFADRMKEVGRFVVVSNDPEDSLRGKTIRR